MNEKEGCTKEMTTSSVAAPLQTDDISFPHVKMEIKTEQEEPVGNSAGLLCPLCTKRFFLVDCFIKHVYEHLNSNNKDCTANDNSTEVMHSNLPSGSEKIENTKLLPGPDHDVLVSGGDNKPLKCGKCSFDTADYATFKCQCIKKRTGEKRFKCTVTGCSFATVWKNNLQRHSMIHSGEKPFKCAEDGCSFATVYKSALRVHSVYAHTEEKPLKFHETGCSNADICKSSMPTEEKPFKCEEPGCSFATLWKPALQNHSKKHSGEKPFKCMEAGCLYATVYKSALQKHLWTHSGEKPFKCMEAGCSYSTVHKSALRTHTIYKHYGEKPFKCDEAGCSYSGMSKSDVQKHKRQHTGEKPFKCTETGCTFSSAQKSNLRSHAIRHKAGRNKPFKLNDGYDL